MSLELGLRLRILSVVAGMQGDSSIRQLTSEVGMGGGNCVDSMHP
jgi:hypothetical protein